MQLQPPNFVDRDPIISVMEVNELYGKIKDEKRRINKSEGLWTVGLGMKRSSGS